MVAKDLMRKYKYGYIHSYELLEEPFVKDLLKENQELKDKISNMQESYETDAEAKFYDYVGKHESKLEKENEELKERLERIDNYLDKYYTVENQYWFDHIRDIVEDK